MCKMKKTISILLAVITIFCCSVIVTGCNKDSTNTDPTAAVTETAEVTEKPSTQTEAKHEYTAVELASKSRDEIIGIMGGEYQTEKAQLCNAFSSEPIDYIHNYDVLPGFAFTSDGSDDNYNIAVVNGGKLNDKISSGMTYSQIANIIGDIDGMLAGAANNIVCNTIVDGYSVTFCFIANDYLSGKSIGGQFSSDVLREGNPGLQSIGLRSEALPKETELAKDPESEDAVSTISDGDAIKLTGTVTVEKDNSSGGFSTSHAILILDNPFKCYLIGTNYDGKRIYEIDSVQIGSEYIDRDGENVTVSGTVMTAHTGHHLRDIVIV